MLVFYSRWIQKLWGGVSRLRKHSSLWGKKGGGGCFGLCFKGGWVLAKQLRCHDCGGERGNKG